MVLHTLLLIALLIVPTASLYVLIKIFIRMKNFTATIHTKDAEIVVKQAQSILNSEIKNINRKSKDFKERIEYFKQLNKRKPFKQV